MPRVGHKFLSVFLTCCLGVCLFSAVEAAGGSAGRGTGKRADEDRQLVAEARFREAFNEFLYSRLDGARSDIVVSGFRIIGNRPVPRGDARLRLFQKSKGKLDGYVRLAAMVNVDGFAENEVVLTGRIDLFGPVACIARNLKKGDVIDKSDVYLERKNTSRLPWNVLTDMRGVVGLVAKHNIKANSVLKEWMLEKAPVVKRGDAVTILAVLGGIRITAPGRTLQKGHSDELIRVRNAMSGKEIYARVIDDSTVAVEL